MKEIIILGDTELGCGDLHDDFISDKTLSRLIRSLARKKHPVDLVLNGDTFDFLKASVKTKKGEYFTVHLTEKIGLQKIRRMHKAHKEVFDALKTFLKKRNQLFFLFGNHDPDLHFAGVQQQIRKWLPGNVFFQKEYTHGPVHAEHGDAFDVMHTIVGAPVRRRGGRKTLNIPWTSMGVIKLQPIKKKHPFLERIKPLPTLFAAEPNLKKIIEKQSLKYAILSVIINPFQLFTQTSFVILKEAWKRFMAGNYEILTVIEKFKDHVLGVKTTTKIHVLGHVHKKRIERAGGLVFIHPDTWRDEYLLKGGKLYPKQKHYVQIILNKDKTTWKLVQVHIKRSIWKFKDVVKNELLFLRKAKEEEA